MHYRRDRVSIKHLVQGGRIAHVSANAASWVGRSPRSLLRARAVIARDGVSLSPTRWLVPRPAVVIGLAPHGALHARGAVSIPLRFRPSPLRLIYFAHEERHRPLHAERMLFTFLDFDAF